MIRILTLSAFLCVTAGSVFQVEASPITFEFSGIVTDVDDAFGAFPSITAGITFSGSYTFDSTAPNGDAAPGPGPIRGSYLSVGAPFGMTIVIGGEIFQMTNLGIEASRFRLTDPPPFDFGADQSSYFLTGFADVAATLHTSLIFQTNNMNRGLDDGSLPLVPPDIALFEENSFSLSVRPSSSTRLDVRGVITSLTLAESVPEPTTLFLLGTGLVGLVGYSRRRGR